MMRSPNWSSKILKEETVTSTNDRLAELCQEKEIKEFTTLMAEYQTAGKGQRGNSWESEYGKNLTFSTVFYPPNNRSRQSVHFIYDGSFCHLYRIGPLCPCRLPANKMAQ